MVIELTKVTRTSFHWKNIFPDFEFNKHYMISFLFFVRLYTGELGWIFLSLFGLVACSLVFKHVESKGSSTPPYFYFLGQYLTTWWFQSFWKLFLSLSLVVYLCSTMNIASVNWPAGPKFEYRRKFYFYEWQEIFKSWSFPKLESFFCHF